MPSSAAGDGPTKRSARQSFLSLRLKAGGSRKDLCALGDGKGHLLCVEGRLRSSCKQESGILTQEHPCPTWDAAVAAQVLLSRKGVKE